MNFCDLLASFSISVCFLSAYMNTPSGRRTKIFGQNSLAPIEGQCISDTAGYPFSCVLLYGGALYFILLYINICFERKRK